MKLVLSVRMGEQIRFPVQRAFFVFFFDFRPRESRNGRSSGLLEGNI